jgi:Zn-dependent protease
MIGVPNKTKYDLVFPLLGMPVRVHPGFWIVAAMLGWVPDDLVYTVIWIAVLFVSILVHEFGHALTARRHKAGGEKVYLYYMGGLASHRPLPAKQSQSVLIWGPGAGLVLGLPCVLLFFLAPPSHPYLYHALMNMIWVNIGWSLVNLVPVFPLDGGQIATIRMEQKHGRYQGMLKAAKLSLITAWVVAGAFLVLQFTKGWGLFAAFLFAYLAHGSQQMKVQLEQSPGSAGGGAAPEPLESWQKPSDWWKK